MKATYKNVSLAIGSIVSPAMIIGSAILLQRVEETAGWASVGLFLRGAVLFCVGMWLFLKVETALSKM